MSCPKTSITDYIRDLDSFLSAVESDAISFKPMGTKIHSYARPSPSSLSSGGASGSTLSSTDDVIEYEVYHVSENFPALQRVASMANEVISLIVNMEYRRVP